MMHSLHSMLKSEEYSKEHDPIEDTLRKLASKMDDSAGSYLLVESLCLLNKKIEALGGATKFDVKLGGGGGGAALVDPFAIQTEAAP